MDENEQRMEGSDAATFRERAKILADLRLATDSIGLLLSCADEWIPEEEHEGLALDIRSHLLAAAKTLERFADRHRELIDLHTDDRLDEVVDNSFGDLRSCLH